VPKRPDTQAWRYWRTVAGVVAAAAVLAIGGLTGHVTRADNPSCSVVKCVALTFDDGPSPTTDELLRVLRRYGAHATFFDVGNRLAYWPEAAREEAELGGVGNHTWSHPALTKLPRLLVWLELMRTQYTVEGELGWKPKLFRTPYALHSRATDAIVHELGLVEVFWDVDARDDVPNARVADIVRTVSRGLRPGAIILMHDLHPWTVRALPKVLDAIAARGLHAVSVPELLALDPPAPGQRCPYGPVRTGA
jgi:peptidoglycan/xylan/chitin deacetylase (PgdA/CDA1 family)